MSAATSHTAKDETQVKNNPAEQQSEHLTQNIPNRRPLKQKTAAQKSVGAFRTISEVADELGVEQHVLRFWETKFTQIKPLKRGGGRRYYRPEDVELLKNIHHLLYTEGYTIKGVQKLLAATRGNLGARSKPAEEASPIAKAVEKNRDELETMLAELKSMRNLIG